MPESAVALRVTELLSDNGGPVAAWQLTALAEVLDARTRRKAADPGPTPIPDTVVNRLCDHARALVGDADAAGNERVIAVRLLARQTQRKEADLKTLGKLLEPQHSPEMQAAAVAALAQLGDDAIPMLVLSRWAQAGPRLRGQLLDLLLARPAWTSALLAAVEAGTVQAAHFDAARRQRLTSYKDKDLRALAVKLLGAKTDVNRQAVVEQYVDVLQLVGDATRGQELFRKKCAVCHKLDGVGNEIGADLAGLKDKSPPALLTAILDPNRAVEDKFVGYLVITTGGLAVAGMIGEESGTAITLRTADGKSQTILRNEIEELQSTGKSHMPEGLEKDLSRQDLADVIRSAGEHLYVVGEGAVIKRVQAAEQRAAAGGADGAVRDAVAEVGALRGELIEARGLDLCVAVAASHIPGVLIAEHEDEVGLGGGEPARGIQRLRQRGDPRRAEGRGAAEHRGFQEVAACQGLIHR